MSDARTPTQIEADIKRRRVHLAETLDEIGVRVHPKTVIGDAKAGARAKLDATLGRGYVAANRAVSSVKQQFVAKDGSPRLERVVPVGVAVVVVASLVVVGRRRRRR